MLNGAFIVLKLIMVHGVMVQNS